MYQLPGFLSFKNLKHAFSDTSEGNMSFNWGKADEVAANRKDFLKKLNIPPDNCVAASLLHGTEIKYIDLSIVRKNILRPNGIEADCLFTKEKGLFLFLLTGDCLPVIIYCPRQSIVVLAHVSRKNTGRLFVKKIVDKLVLEFNCRSTELEVGIGPALHKNSYKKTKVPEQGVSDWQKYITEEADGQISIDLIGYNKQQMIEAGILLEKIEVSGIDTARSKKFFSHRRSEITGEPEGRLATVVGLVNK